MAAASVTNTFTSATAAVSSEVNRNFTDLVDFANDDTVHRDGSKSFSGDMSMGSNKITNVAAGTAANDAVNVAQLGAALPTGFIGMHGGASAPTGWLLCDGSLVSRTGYADLFAAVGTSFGAGDGSTTFAVPDFTDSFPFGTTPGTTGGSNDAVVIDHSHSLSAHTHSFSHTHAVDPPDTFMTPDTGSTFFNRLPSGGLSGDVSGWSYSSSAPSNQTTFLEVDIPSFTSGAASTSTTGGGSTSSGSTGVAGTGLNRPAFVGVTFIIKSGL